MLPCLADSFAEAIRATVPTLVPNGKVLQRDLKPNSHFFAVLLQDLILCSRGPGPAYDRGFLLSTAQMRVCIPGRECSGCSHATTLDGSNRLIRLGDSRNRANAAERCRSRLHHKTLPFLTEPLQYLTDSFAEAIRATVPTLVPTGKVLQRDPKHNSHFCLCEWFVLLSCVLLSCACACDLLIVNQATHLQKRSAQPCRHWCSTARCFNEIQKKLPCSHV